MIGQDKIKKIGRPKKQRIVLDTSMTPDQAKDQNVIATAKEKMYKAEIQRIKALEANKSVIDTQVVTGIVVDIFTKLKTLLYASTNKLPAQIAGKEHAEVTQIMYKFVDETLHRMVEDFDNKIKSLNVEIETEDELEEEIGDE